MINCVWDALKDVPRTKARSVSTSKLEKQSQNKKSSFTTYLERLSRLREQEIKKKENVKDLSRLQEKGITKTARNFKYLTSVETFVPEVKSYDECAIQSSMSQCSRENIEEVQLECLDRDSEQRKQEEVSNMHDSCGEESKEEVEKYQPTEKICDEGDVTVSGADVDGADVVIVEDDLFRNVQNPGSASPSKTEHCNSSAPKNNAECEKFKEGTVKYSDISFFQDTVISEKSNKVKTPECEAKLDYKEKVSESNRYKKKQDGYVSQEDKFQGNTNHSDRKRKAGKSHYCKEKKSKGLYEEDHIQSSWKKADDVGEKQNRKLIDISVTNTINVNKRDVAVSMLRCGEAGGHQADVVMVEDEDIFRKVRNPGSAFLSKTKPCDSNEQKPNAEYETVKEDTVKNYNIVFEQEKNVSKKSLKDSMSKGEARLYKEKVSESNKKKQLDAYVSHEVKVKGSPKHSKHKRKMGRSHYSTKKKSKGLLEENAIQTSGKKVDDGTERQNTELNKFTLINTVDAIDEGEVKGNENDNISVSSNLELHPHLQKDTIHDMCHQDGVEKETVDKMNIKVDDCFQQKKPKSDEDAELLVARGICEELDFPSESAGRDYHDEIINFTSLDLVSQRGVSVKVELSECEEQNELEDDSERCGVENNLESENRDYLGRDNWGYDQNSFNGRPESSCHNTSSDPGGRDYETNQLQQFVSGIEHDCDPENEFRFRRQDVSSPFRGNFTHRSQEEYDVETYKHILFERDFHINQQKEEVEYMRNSVAWHQQVRNKLDQDLNVAHRALEEKDVVIQELKERFSTFKDSYLVGIEEKLRENTAQHIENLKEQLYETQLKLQEERENFAKYQNETRSRSAELKSRLVHCSNIMVEKDRVISELKKSNARYRKLVSEKEDCIRQLKKKNCQFEKIIKEQKYEIFPSTSTSDLHNFRNKSSFKGSDSFAVPQDDTTVKQGIIDPKLKPKLDTDTLEYNMKLKMKDKEILKTKNALKQKEQELQCLWEKHKKRKSRMSTYKKSNMEFKKCIVSREDMNAQLEEQLQEHKSCISELTSQLAAKDSVVLHLLQLTGTSNGPAYQDSSYSMATTATANDLNVDCPKDKDLQGLPGDEIGCVKDIIKESSYRCYSGKGISCVKQEVIDENRENSEQMCEGNVAEVSNTHQSEKRGSSDCSEIKHEEAQQSPVTINLSEYRIRNSVAQVIAVIAERKAIEIVRSAQNPGKNRVAENHENEYTYDSEKQLDETKNTSPAQKSVRIEVSSYMDDKVVTDDQNLYETLRMFTEEEHEQVKKLKQALKISAKEESEQLIKELEEKIRERDAGLAKLEGQTGAEDTAFRKQEDRNHLYSLLDSKSIMLTNTEEVKEALAEKCAVITSELEEVNREKINLENKHHVQCIQLEEFRHVIIAKDATLLDSEREKEVLKMDIHNCKETYNKKLRSVENALAEEIKLRTVFENERNACEITLKERENSLCVLQKEIEELLKTITEKDKYIFSLEEGNEILNGKMISKEQEIKELQRLTSTNERQLEEKDEILCKIGREGETFKAKVDLLKTECKHLRDRVSNLENFIESKDQTVQEVLLEKSQLEELVKSKGEAISTFIEEKQKSEECINTLKTVQDSTVKEMEELKASYNESRNVLAVRNEEILCLQRNIEHLTHKINEDEKYRLAQDESLASLREEKATLTLKLATLEKEFEEIVNLNSATRKEEDKQGKVLITEGKELECQSERLEEEGYQNEDHQNEVRSFLQIMENKYMMLQKIMEDRREPKSIFDSDEEDAMECKNNESSKQLIDTAHTLQKTAMKSNEFKSGSVESQSTADGKSQEISFLLKDTNQLKEKIDEGNENYIRKLNETLSSFKKENYCLSAKVIVIERELKEFEKLKSSMEGQLTEHGERFLRYENEVDNQETETERNENVAMKSKLSDMQVVSDNDNLIMQNLFEANCKLKEGLISRTGCIKKLIEAKKHYGELLSTLKLSQETLIDEGESFIEAVTNSRLNCFIQNQHSLCQWEDMAQSKEFSCEDSEQKLQQLTESLLILKEDNVSLNLKVAAFKQEVSDLKGIRCSLENNLMEKEKALAEKIEEAAALRCEVEKQNERQLLENENDILKRQIENQVITYQILIDNHHKLQEICKSREECIRQLQEEQRSGEELIKQLESSNETLVEELENARNIYTECKAQLTLKNVEISDVKEAMDQHKEKIRGLEESQLEQTRAYNTLYEAKVSLTSELTIKEKEIRDLDGVKDSLQTLLQEQENVLVDVRKRSATLEGKAKESNNIILTLNNEVSNLQCVVESKNYDLDKVLTEKSILEEDGKVKEEKMKRDEEEKRMMEKVISNLKSHHETLTKELDEVRSVNSCMTAVVSSKDQEILCCQKKLDELKGKMAENNEKHLMMISEKEKKWKAELDTAAKNVQTLKKCKSSLDSKFSELRALQATLRKELKLGISKKSLIMSFNQVIQEVRCLNDTLMKEEKKNSEVMLRLVTERSENANLRKQLQVASARKCVKNPQNITRECQTEVFESEEMKTFAAEQEKLKEALETEKIVSEDFYQQLQAEKKKTKYLATCLKEEFTEISKDLELQLSLFCLSADKYRDKIKRLEELDKLNEMNSCNNVSV